MAKIIINRSTEFSNRIRAIRIYIDKQKIGEIYDGESKEFEISPGKHTLKAKIDWCGSNTIEFVASEEDTPRFSLCGTDPFLALFYITLARNRYLVLGEI
jgi:hypothetical protein